MLYFPLKKILQKKIYTKPHVSFALEELKFYNEELSTWEFDGEYTVFAGSDCKKAEELTAEITL